MTPTLDSFCKSIAAKRRLTPTGLGLVFVKFFSLSSPPTMDELKGVLRRAGVGSISGAPLPKGMLGCHYSLDSAPYTINYRKGDRVGVRKQTVLHETYEIIEEMLNDRQVDPARDRRLCREADRFAWSVLELPDMFATCAGASRRAQRPRRLASSLAGASLLRLAHSGRRLPAFSIMARNPDRGRPLRGPHPFRLRGIQPWRRTSRDGRALRQWGGRSRPRSSRTDAAGR